LLTHPQSRQEGDTSTGISLSTPILIKDHRANDVCSPTVAQAPSVRQWAHRNVSLLLCHKVHLAERRRSRDYSNLCYKPWPWTWRCLIIRSKISKAVVLCMKIEQWNPLKITWKVEIHKNK
jgi:hypothetical protein